MLFYINFSILNKNDCFAVHIIILNKYQSVPIKAARGSRLVTEDYFLEHFPNYHKIPNFIV